MKTIIHVNQHHIRSNKKNGTNLPVLTVKTYKTNEYGYGVDIQGPAKIIYSPDKPLQCGARVWIETTSRVKIIKKPKKVKVNLCHVWEQTKNSPINKPKKLSSK